MESIDVWVRLACSTSAVVRENVIFRLTQRAFCLWGAVLMQTAADLRGELNLLSLDQLFFHISAYEQLAVIFFIRKVVFLIWEEDDVLWLVKKSTQNHQAAVIIIPRSNQTLILLLQLLFLPFFFKHHETGVILLAFWKEFPIFCLWENLQMIFKLSLIDQISKALMLAFPPSLSRVKSLFKILKNWCLNWFL